jgi:anti-anti-sigma factor
VTNIKVDRGSLVLVRVDQPCGITARGTLDVGQIAYLTGTLERLAAESGGELLLDCAGLDFAGVDALRAIVQTAGVLHAAERRLRVRGLSPYYARVLQLAGWDQTPGLLLDAA